MASRIQAINTMRPKLKRGKTAQFDEVVDFIASHTGLNYGEIAAVLHQLVDAVIFHNLQGRGVKLPGLGTYLPNIGLDGSLNLEHRQDRGLKRQLNRPGAFVGKVLNHRNIGMTPDELVELWNAAHPEDPVDGG